MKKFIKNFIKKYVDGMLAVVLLNSFIYGLLPHSIVAHYALLLMYFVTGIAYTVDTANYKEEVAHLKRKLYEA